MARMNKYTFEDAIKIFKQNNFTILDDESKYKNVKTKLLCVCNKHKDKPQYRTVSSFNRGTGCRFCKYDEKRLPFEKVKKMFEKNNFTLLEDESKYDNVNSELLCICNRHKEESHFKDKFQFEERFQFKDYMSLKRGNGCKVRGYEKASLKNRIPFRELKKIFEEKGYKLLITKEDYEDIDTPFTNKYVLPIPFECPNHKHKKDNKLSYDYLKNGGECRYC